MPNFLQRLRSSEFFRNVFTLVSVTSIAQAVSILIYPVLTRLYSPGEMGLFSLYMSIISLTGILSTGKYELAVLLPKEDRHAEGLVGLSLVLVTFFSACGLLTVVLFRDTFAQWLGNPLISPWLLFVPLSTLLVGYFQVLSYRDNRIKRYKRMAGANLGQSIVNSAVKLGFFRVLSNGGGLIAGAVAGQMAGLAVFLWKQNLREIFNGFNLRLFREMARKYRKFPYFNLPHYLVNNFSSGLPVFLFSSKAGAAEAGFYSLGLMMVNRPMNLLTASVTQVFSQKIIDRYNRRLPVKQEVIRLSRRLALAGLLPFAAAALAGPSVFSFVFGEEWAVAGRYMQVLLPWLFLVLVSSPLSFLPDMTGRQQKAMWLDILKFVLRFIALIYGLHFGKVLLSLALFSAVGTIMAAYSLWWYFQLAGMADSEGKTDPEIPTVLKDSSGTGILE